MPGKECREQRTGYSEGSEEERFLPKRKVGEGLTEELLEAEPKQELGKWEWSQESWKEHVNGLLKITRYREKNVQFTILRPACQQIIKYQKL